MRDSLIETFVKIQYDLLKWFIIGWTVWFGGFIVMDLIQPPYILGLVVLLGLVGWFMFVINLLRLFKLNKQLGNNQKLKNALADELALHHKDQAFTIGFWALIISVAVFLIVTLFFSIPSLLICQLLLFIGVLSPSITFLILNRP